VLLKVGVAGIKGTFSFFGEENGDKGEENGDIQGL
jgi:hypothetical protein